MPDPDPNAMSEPVGGVVPEEDAISIPLYVAGLVVTLCGLQAVNLAMSDPTNPVFAATTLLLTLIGFAFSFGCRWLKIQPRLIDSLLGLLVVYVVYSLATHQINMNLLTPGDRPTLRMAVALAWIAVLYSWTLVSDTRVLCTCVLPLAMLGVVVPENAGDPANLVCFGAYLAAATFLLIHQNYLYNRALASAQERAREPGGLVWGQAALAAICVLVVLSVGTVVVVPIQAVTGRFSLAAEMHKLVGTGKATEPPTPLVTTHFSDSSNFAVGTGSGWLASSEVVMHVTPDDNQEHYWRGRTYDRYDGTGWQSTLESPTQPLDPAQVLDGGGTVLSLPAALTPGEDATPNGQHFQTEYDVKGITDQFYYAPGGRALILPRSRSAMSEGQISWSPDGSLSLQGGSVQGSYETESVLTPDPSLPAVQEGLRHAGHAYPREVHRHYLHNIIGTVITADDQAFYQSAAAEAVQGLPRNRHDPFDETAAIRDWVAARCIYSLNVPPIPADQDHVHYFLDTSRRGYCDLFASAMAVLCRTRGIPARVATGFAPGERDPSGFSLRAMDKHAWVEVYFPHFGWLTFDPTVGTRADNSVPAGETPGAPLWSRLLRSLTAQGPVPAILAGLIVAILLYLFKVEVYDRWRETRRARPASGVLSAAAMRSEVGRQYAQFTRALAGLGLPRRSAETPDEYAARATDFLTTEGAALGVALPTTTVLALTRQFATARYGGDATVAESADLRQAVTEFQSAAAQARRRRLWQHLWRRKQNR